MIGHAFFSETARLSEIAAPVATGTSVVDSTPLDMSQWDGALFIVRFGSPAANNNIRAQQGSLPNLADAADLAGTLVNSASINAHVLDVKRTREQFVRCRITRGTTTTVDSLIAIQYRGRRPAVQPATVVLERHSEEPEGVA